MVRRTAYRKLWGGLRQNSYSYLDKVWGHSPTAYWPLSEGAGSIAVCETNTAYNGAYTGVTLGQPGIGDGLTCPYFDGLTDYVDIYSAALAAAFDGDEGSLIAWARVANAGVWTDAAIRAVAHLNADDDNYIRLNKHSFNNTVRWTREASNVAQQRAKANADTTDWFFLTITWSVSADQVCAYWNGALVGAPMAGLLNWVGALAATSTVIGAFTTAPANVWHGYAAHVALWCGTVLTPTQIADLCAIPR